jgi:UDP-N-acetyl-D-mannosaminuronate dehydrogenase
MQQPNEPRLAVVGLGDVGLPLAVEFGKKFDTVGYDLSKAKISHYKNHYAPTGEVNTEDLKAATRLSVTADPSAISEADVIAAAGPTPVAIVAAVSHQKYLVMPLGDILAKLDSGGIFVDVESAYDADAIQAANCSVWGL